MRSTALSYFLLVSLSLVSGVLGALLVSVVISPSQASLIRDFYRTENAVHVSPHSLRKKIAKGEKDFVLVDLRSAQEYEREHIVGAVSIPAYRDPDHSAYDEMERIAGAFHRLPADKEIIVYCYSIPCMTGRKVGEALAERGIFIQHLGIGWNEWRHFWTLWNHEHEWDSTHVEDYVARGPDPGQFSGSPDLSPCVEGQFGC